MKRPYGVGIVGVQPGRSWAFLAHMPSLRVLPEDFRIAGIANTSLDSAKRAAAELGISGAFASVADMVASPDVDIVTVTVKVPHHHEIVRAALEAGKHVFCEWPLGNGLAEAIELADLARAKGLHGVVGTQARVSPAMRYLRDLVAEGYVGDVLSATLASGAPMAIHYRGGMPRGTGLLWEINGTNGDLQVSATGGHAQFLDLAIKGATGDQPALEDLPVPERYHATHGLDPYAQNVGLLYEALAADLANGTQTAPSFDDAVATHRFIDAVERASESGQRVMVDG